MKRLRSEFTSQYELRAITWLVCACLLSVFLPLTLRSQSLPSAPNLLPGQTATKLPDGRLLLLGGESGGRGTNTASIWDPRTGSTNQLFSRLNQGRAWHSATILPDGLVLILGGTSSANQLVSTVELFDPAASHFIDLPTTGVTARARHTATLLSDGQVLIAGGVDANGAAIQTAELWDTVQPLTVNVSALTSARRGHTATLLADGRVLLWGGADDAGRAINGGDLFDPATQRFAAVGTFPSALIPLATDGPGLVASIPLDRSVDIDVESMVSLRFSKPLRPESVNTSTVSLNGPKGLEKITVVPAENGLLAFITPEGDLLPGATYTVTVNGAIDRDGLFLPVSGISFSTKRISGGAESSSTPGGLQVVSPSTGASPGSSDDDLIWKGKLKDGKPHSDWQDLPPLQAPPGITALAGQVLNLRGFPLAKVKLEIESGYGSQGKSVETDETGRFLLSEIEPGWAELIINGHGARRRLNDASTAVAPAEDHGLFEYGLDVKKGETLVLPFTIWLPKIDVQHAVPIPQNRAANLLSLPQRLKIWNYACQPMAN